MEHTKKGEPGRGNASHEDNQKDNNPWANDGEETKRVLDPNLLKFEANGTVSIRILPNKDEFEKPFFKYRIQYVPVINERYPKAIISGKVAYNIIDAYVGTRWEEWNEIKEGHSGDKEKAKASKEGKKCLELINQHKAKPFVDMNVIVRETGKIQKLSANPTIYDAIMGYAKNPEYGNPSDIKHGYDFKITTVTEQGKPMSRKYTVVAGRAATPLTDEEIKMLETAPSIERPMSTDEEVQKIAEASKEMIVMPKTSKEPIKKDEEVIDGVTGSDDDPDGLVLDRPDEEEKTEKKEE